MKIKKKTCGKKIGRPITQYLNIYRKGENFKSTEIFFLLKNDRKQHFQNMLLCI